MANANTRFKVENGLVVLSNSTANSEFYGNVEFTANVTVVGNLVVTGTYIIIGSTVTQGSETVSSSIIPALTATASLGNTTNRWTGFLNNLYVTNQILPSGSTAAIGNTTNRFDLFTINTNIAGNTYIGGNTTIGMTLFVDNALKRVGINKSNPTVTLDVNGPLSATGNTNINGSLIINNTTTSPTVIELGTMDMLHKTVTPFSAYIPFGTTYSHEIIRFPKAGFRGGKFFIAGLVRWDTNAIVQMVEAVLTWNGTDVSIVEYGKITTTPSGIGSTVDTVYTLSVEEVGENIIIYGSYKSQFDGFQIISSNCLGHIFNNT